LTIKLTQRDPIISDLQGNRLEGSCKPFRPIPGVLCLSFAKPQHRLDTPHVEQVRLSTLRYSRAKLAVFRITRTLKFAQRDANFCQLSKNFSRCNFYRDLRSRRSALAIWSRHCDANWPKIKNPASSAGHVRPLDVAAFYPRSLPDAYARSSFFWFPVFVTNPTSAFDSRPGPSGESPTNYGATDIRRVYLISRFRQVFADYFL